MIEKPNGFESGNSKNIYESKKGQQGKSTGKAADWSEHNKNTEKRVIKLKRFSGAETDFSLRGVTDFEKQSAVFKLLNNNLEEIRVLLLEQASFYKQKQTEMLENKVSGEIASVWNDIISEYIKALEHLMNVTFENNIAATKDIIVALHMAQTGMSSTKVPIKTK